MLPSVLKIGGYKVSIKEVPHLATDRGSVGEWVPRTQEIVLEVAASGQQKEEVLIHEILEAIKDFYDLNIEHHVIQILGVVLHQVLKDNPILFRFGGREET